jgi:8-oxo-dGTP pyrophosphatase MutT (NUDIX family)
MSKIRHFTATGFVVHGDATLLHWHKKVQEWLPPGGHVEPNEDPVQTTLREITEETGMHATIVPTYDRLDISNLEQVDAPHSIMIENVFDTKDGEHQHIDHIYFTRAVSANGTRPPAPDQWIWVTRDELETQVSFTTPNGDNRVPPEDVLKLGLAAINHVNAADR